MSAFLLEFDESHACGARRGWDARVARVDPHCARRSGLRARCARGVWCGLCLRCALGVWCALRAWWAPHAARVDLLGEHPASTVDLRRPLPKVSGISSCRQPSRRLQTSSVAAEAMPDTDPSERGDMHLLRIAISATLCSDRRFDEIPPSVLRPSRHASSPNRNGPKRPRYINPRSAKLVTHPAPTTR